MLAFDSPWWITGAIAIVAVLRVWMANLRSLPKSVPWIMAALVLGAAFVWLQRAQATQTMPASMPVMVMVALLLAAGMLYLFDIDRARKHKPGILELLDSLLIALLLVFCILRPFVIQAFFIPSGSMLDTLQIQDRILVNKFVYFMREPSHGEIIVFRAPPWADPGKKDFIKRVIGLPGDHIAVHDGRVWRNGAPLDEPYIKEPPRYNWPVLGQDRFAPGVMVDASSGGRDWEVVLRDGSLGRVGEVVVPPRAVLVMGDNRNDSMDSHAWWRMQANGEVQAMPFVPRENVLGKARFIFWPLFRVRLID